jgi:hypothetical protein
MYNNLKSKRGDKFMQDEKGDQVKNILSSEIEALQKHYSTIIQYLAGKKYDAVEIISIFQIFRNGLNKISSHIVTFYVLKGQKSKITWQSLLENLENAINTLQASAKPNPRATIELAFKMSQPNAQEVMEYLSQLKESLK